MIEAVLPSTIQEDVETKEVVEGEVVDPIVRAIYIAQSLKSLKKAFGWRRSSISPNIGSRNNN